MDGLGEDEFSSGAEALEDGHLFGAFQDAGINGNEDEQKADYQGDDADKVDEDDEGFEIGSDDSAIVGY